MSKNIEKIKGEDALSEIVDVVLDDTKLDGLVSNDVADMYQEASGLKPLKPIDTYESPIVELKANLKLIFRRLFSVPLTMLGSNKEASPISVIEMFRQMFNHYRERLKGSETYGIPSRLSSLTDLPSAPLLVSDRKISGADVADGMSLVHLLLNNETAEEITELTDDNVGWDCNKTFDTSAFTNISHIVINAKRQTAGHVLANGSKVEVLEVGFEEVTGGCFLSTDNTGAILFPRLHTVLFNKLKKLTYASGIYERGWINPRENNMPLMSDWHFPVLEEIVNGVYLFCFYGNSIDIKRIYMEAIETANNPIQRRGYTIALEYLYIGYTKNKGTGFIQSASLGGQCFTIELKQGYGMNLNIAGYAPTLDSSNLQQFLQNFRTYIALRLATFASNGPTLTLSQAVYDAIKDESHLFVFDEGTMTIYAYLTNIKHWTVTK